MWLHWMWLQCLKYFRQNALALNFQDRTKHVCKNLTAQYVIHIVHDYRVLAYSVFIVQDRNGYIWNSIMYITAVLKILDCNVLDCSVQYLSLLYCNVNDYSVCIVRVKSYHICNYVMHMTAVLRCTSLQCILLQCTGLQCAWLQGTSLHCSVYIVRERM